MKSYYLIMQECWKKSGGNGSDSSILFSKKDLHDAAKDLNLTVRNIADIKYTFDSREQLVLGDQYYCILQRSRGHYGLIASEKPTLIMPSELTAGWVFADKTPAIVKKFIGTDEQAALTKFEYNAILQNVLGAAGLKKVQDHWRTTCSVGQIEVDSLCVYESDGEIIPVIISVKQLPDLLSTSYMYNLNKLSVEKFDGKAKIINIYIDEGCYLIWEAKPVSPTSTDVVSCQCVVINDTI